jgi:hypothetical protein
MVGGVLAQKNRTLLGKASNSGCADPNILISNTMIRDPK